MCVALRGDEPETASAPAAIVPTSADEKRLADNACGGRQHSGADRRARLPLTSEGRENEAARPVGWWSCSTGSVWGQMKGSMK
jgi:hypothetical protein